MKTDAKTSLILFYVEKIKKDAEDLSKKGISSKTYQRKELDCSLGMLSSILAVSHKIRAKHIFPGDNTITFTWK
jgi:hypothetical protein